VKSCEVNGHTTRYTSRVFLVLQLQLGAWLKANGTEIRAPLWTHEARGGLCVLMCKRLVDESLYRNVVVALWLITFGGLYALGLLSMAVFCK